MGNLLGSCYNANLVQRSNFRAQPSVHTEHFAIYNGGQCKEIEYLAASFPYRCISVLRLALFVKAVDLGNLSGLVISPD